MKKIVMFLCLLAFTIVMANASETQNNRFCVSDNVEYVVASDVNECPAFQIGNADVFMCTEYHLCYFNSVFATEEVAYLANESVCMVNHGSINRACIMCADGEKPLVFRHKDLFCRSNHSKYRDKSKCIYREGFVIKRPIFVNVVAYS
jgi:hypothetical protein